MVRYDDYKDSGIDWIGEIPSGWELRRIKSLVSNIDETIPDNPPITIPLERVMPWTGEIAINDSIDDGDGCSKGFKGGDILFSKLRPYLAKAVLAPCDGACSGEMLVLRADNIERSYLHKIVLSPGFIDAINAMTYGAKMPRASWDLLKDIVVPLPSWLEQEKIASWLNKTTGEIDTTVHNIEASICLLHEYRQSIITEAVTHGLDLNAPIKNSGLDWLEFMPEHWAEVPLDQAAERHSGHTPNKSTPEYWENGDIVWISLADSSALRKSAYVSSSMTMTNALGIAHSSAEILPKGCVLLSRDASVGLCAIADCELAVSQHFMAYVCRHNLDNKYLLYCFKSMDQYFKKLSMGSTIPTIGLSLIKAIKIPLPPICEQRQIVKFLDTKTAEIDTLIASKTRQVELLREYRKSIISEAVTGKFKVPGLE